MGPEIIKAGRNEATLHNCTPGPAREIQFPRDDRAREIGGNSLRYGENLSAKIRVFDVGELRVVCGGEKRAAVGCSGWSGVFGNGVGESAAGFLAVFKIPRVHCAGLRLCVELEGCSACGGRGEKLLSHCEVTFQ